MADKKSKLPSLDELGKYAGKLFKDIKYSVKEIIDDYQKSRPADVDDTEDKAEDSETQSPVELTETTPADEKRAAKTKSETKATDKSDENEKS